MTYEISVEALEARLIDVEGGRHDAKFFVHSMRGDRNRPESLADRLNDSATRFLACEMEGALQLVRRSWIAAIEIAGSPPERLQLEEVGARREAVVLHLGSGQVLEGEVCYEEARPGYRVSDLLNDQGPPFLLLEAGEKVYFVNREIICRVSF